jgi:translation initiation factor IF-3
MAEEAELDLVEVAPNARPPVCRILDYRKFAYERTKQLREAQRNQKQIELKKIRLTPRTSTFHRDIHVKKAREWLTEGKKVQFMVRFKARERDYPEIGRDSLLEIAELLGDVSTIEQQPKFEGWSMTLTLAPENAS